MKFDDPPELSYALLLLLLYVMLDVPTLKRDCG